MEQAIGLVKRLIIAYLSGPAAQIAIEIRPGGRATAGAGANEIGLAVLGGAPVVAPDREIEIEAVAGRAARRFVIYAGTAAALMLDSVLLCNTRGVDHVRDAHGKALR